MTIQHWAIVDKKDRNVVYGGICLDGHDHEHFSAVFETQKEARRAKKLHSKFYRSCVVRPIKILVL